MVSVSTIGLLAATLLAAPEVPKSGQICTLLKPLVVSGEADGKGKKTRLKKDDTFALVTWGKKLSKVRIGDEDGVVRTVHMVKRCIWSHPPLPGSEDDEEFAMAAAQPALAPPFTPARARPASPSLPARRMNVGDAVERRCSSRSAPSAGVNSSHHSRA